MSTRNTSRQCNAALRRAMTLLYSARAEMERLTALLKNAPTTYREDGYTTDFASVAVDANAVLWAIQAGYNAMFSHTPPPYWPRQEREEMEADLRRARNRRANGKGRREE